MDTADMYGDGRGEEFVGNFVRRRRDQVVLATKFAFVLKEGTQYDYSISNRPDYIRFAIDASLRRLGIDVIDLYYMHRRDTEVPLADSLGAMAYLVAAGKVRHLGLSEVTGRSYARRTRSIPAQPSSGMVAVTRPPGRWRWHGCSSTVR